MNCIKPHLVNLLDNNKRFDGRSDLLSYRAPIKVEYGITKTAEGSARVTIGKTVVIAGIKLELGTPYPDQPDKGTIMVGAELIPMSSPRYEPGPPTMKAIELARVVDRGIRESQALDFKKLCISEGEKVWIVSIDIVSINDDGGLLDASALAALAALKDAKYPVIENDKVNYKEKSDKAVELEKLPVAITVFKIGKNLILDPTVDEELATDARLTVTSTEDGNLCALQKGGNYTFTSDEVSKILDIALEKGKELRSIL